jgi:hypothetical protein
MEIKRKIQIGILLYICLLVLGYIFYPIITFLFNVISIGLLYKWAKKRGIKMTFTFKKKK